MADKKPKAAERTQKPINLESLTGIKGKIIKPEEIRPGYTLRVHQKIKEEGTKGERERIQIFEGMVLGVRGSGISRTITVRKISEGIGVEKIFPVNLPSIVAFELTKIAKVRRAKLGHLRTWGKRLKETTVTA